MNKKPNNKKYLRLFKKKVFFIYVRKENNSARNRESL